MKREQLSITLSDDELLLVKLSWMNYMSTTKENITLNAYMRKVILDFMQVSNNF